MSIFSYIKEASNLVKGNFAPLLLATIFEYLPLVIIIGICSNHGIAIYFGVVFCIFALLMYKYSWQVLGLRVVNRERVECEYLFTELKNFGRIALLNLHTFFMNVLGTICFIYPGFVSLRCTSFANFILRENPTLSQKAILKQSREISKKCKYELLKINLFFLPLYIISPFTLGAILFFAIPYRNICIAMVYKKYSENQTKNIEENQEITQETEADESSQKLEKLPEDKADNLDLKVENNKKSDDKFKDSKVRTVESILEENEKNEVEETQENETQESSTKSNNS